MAFLLFPFSQKLSTINLKQLKINWKQFAQTSAPRNLPFKEDLGIVRGGGEGAYTLINDQHYIITAIYIYIYTQIDLKGKDQMWGAKEPSRGCFPWTESIMDVKTNHAFTNG